MDDLKIREREREGERERNKRNSESKDKGGACREFYYSLFIFFGEDEGGKGGGAELPPNPSQSTVTQTFMKHSRLTTSPNFFALQCEQPP